MRGLMVSVVSIGLLAGCATSPPLIVHAPMPADIGWSTPRHDPPEELSPIPPREPGPAEQVMLYEEGSPVKVNVGVKSGLALQFDPDEFIVSVKGAYEEVKPEGDQTEPWKAVIERSGSKYPLVYLTATRPGMTTSFMIPTNKGLYLVDARSVASSKVRVVRWSREGEPAPPVVRKTSLLPDPMVPAIYHGGYTMEPAVGGPVWRPTAIVDNGRRTFIVLPRNLSVMSAPMARMIGQNGPELINPVLVDHVMVLDHLVPYALELRVGSGEQAEVVRIVRGNPVRMTCPGDAACPVWSERVAGR